MKIKLLIIAMGAFYILAGANHFINPDFYYPLIPEYLHFPKAINIISGIIEIIFGIGVLIPSFRKIASWGIILMLIAFIPSHIYFIQIGGCIQEGLCVPRWVAWLRLIVIHPILIFWAFMISKK
jgi:uncharacterized membrane protein